MFEGRSHAREGADRPFSFVLPIAHLKLHVRLLLASPFPQSLDQNAFFKPMKESRTVPYHWHESAQCSILKGKQRADQRRIHRYVDFDPNEAG